MKQDDVTCKDVMMHICDNLGEDLHSERCIAIKQHLENCDACKNYFNSVEHTIDLYRNYNAELTDDCHKRLMSFLKLEE